MPRLGAEMRHVNDRGRVIRQHGQTFASRQRLKPFAGLQNGQGAQQAGGVELIGYLCHKLQIGGMFQSVHKDVTTPWGDAVTRMG